MDFSAALPAVSCDGAARLRFGEPRASSRGDQFGVAQLAREQLIRGLPEGAVTTRPKDFGRKARRRQRVLVKRQRQVLEHHAHVLGKALAELVERGSHAAAEGTLKLRELDDGDHGVCGPDRG